MRPTIFDGTETREMNQAEFAQYQLDQAEAEAQAEADAAKDVARQAALNKLGLTSDEVAALFG